MSRFLVLNFQDFGLDHHITETIQSQTLFCICCLDKNVPLLNLSTCEHAQFLETFPKSEVRTFKDVICYHCHEVLKKIEAFRQQVQRSFKILEAEKFNISGADHIRANKFETKKTVNIYLPPIKSGKCLNSHVKEPMMHNAEIIHEKYTSAENEEKKRPRKRKKCASKSNTDTGKSIKVPCQDKELPVVMITPLVIKTEANEPDKSESVRPEINEFEPKEIKTEPGETVNQFDNFISVSDTGVNLPQTQDPMIPKIKTVKISKEELAKERLQWAQSPGFLRYPHRCEHCLVGFNYEDNVRDHMKRKHGPKIGSITCEICLQVLYPPGSLNAHNFRHYTRIGRSSKRVRRSLCEERPQLAVTSSVAASSSSDRYECEECGVRFSEFEAALQHYRRAHRPRPPGPACPHCGFIAKNQHQLSLHKLKHERHSCRYCGLVVGAAAILRRHMLIAHKKCIHKCADCKTEFDNEEAYVSHMRSHSSLSSLGSLVSGGARCGVCNLTFSSWHAYNSHLALSSAHAKHARYKCEECGMRFSMASRLGNHARNRHARPLALRCKYCPRVFSLPIEVKQHIRKVHDEKWITNIMVCDHCGKAYETRKHLIRHIAETHPQPSLNRKVKTKAKEGKT